MSDERSYVQVNAPTVVSVWLCALLGYGLLVGATMLYKKMTGG